jgi:hypothetical protein
VKDELKYAFREKRCLVFAAATKIDMAKWEAEGVADEGHAEDALEDLADGKLQGAARERQRVNVDAEAASHQDRQPANAEAPAAQPAATTRKRLKTSSTRPSYATALV